MSITVETRYRVTVDGTVLDLDEGAATALMEALAHRLLPRIDVTPMQTQVHVLHTEPVGIAAPAPKALPEPTPEPSKPAPPQPDEAAPIYRIPGEGLTPAGEAKLREMHEAGAPHSEIGRVLGLPTGTVSSYCFKRGLKRNRTVNLQSPSMPASPSTPRFNRGDDWTLEQTKALIHLMANGSGLKEAMRATGHSFLSCERRWRHLKEAGLMTVERYLAHPESTLDGVPA